MRNYSIDIIDGVAVISFLEQPSLDDVRRAIGEVAEIGGHDLKLWDLSRSGVELTSAQLKEIADYSKIKFSAPSSVAIVAPKDLAFGLSRMYEIYREQPQIALKVFRTREDALAWLKG
jgi:hypothetical protein